MSFNIENLLQNNSFSGSDIVASITIPGESSPYIIGELQTISYSLHREINPVRTLGRINPVGFVRGPRTIAGSLVFVVFDKSLVRKLQDRLIRDITVTNNPVPKSLLTDEMPPFDVTISFANEFGQRSVLKIFGIIIVNEGQVMSVNDMMTESTMNYVARDIELLDKN